MRFEEIAAGNLYVFEQPLFWVEEICGKHAAKGFGPIGQMFLVLHIFSSLRFCCLKVLMSGSPKIVVIHTSYFANVPIKLIIKKV